MSRRPGQSAHIRGFWSGPPLSAIHRACLRSFLAHGHEFTLYCYAPVDVPPGVQTADANAIVPEQEIFYFQNRETGAPDIAPFADYFRAKLLSEVGGWYCDVDTVCLSSELPAGPRVWARQCPELNPDSVNNSQLFLEKTDPVVHLLLEHCRAQAPTIRTREELGPVLMSSIVTKLDLPRDMGATADTFYPIRWIEIFKLWLPEFRAEVEERTLGATFLPLYQSFPSYVGLDPQKQPPAGSYLSALVERFVPEARGACHTAEEVRDRTRRWFDRNRSWSFGWIAAIGRPEAGFLRD